MTKNPDHRHDLPAHFQGKEALAHVAEAQADGLFAAAEIHGTETPGHITAGADAARETSLVLLFVWFLLLKTGVSFSYTAFSLSIFALGWLIWKVGRSVWLAWSRLERLHRIVAQEKYEIDHHRQQEREELKELYASKGFEGKLLEDVLDVLMADDGRLLRVMVEEELGLSLATDVHPLKQGLGAFVGGVAAFTMCILGFYIDPSRGLLFAAIFAIACGSGILAYRAQNRIIPAVIWNIGLSLLAFAFIYFFSMYSP